MVGYTLLRIVVSSLLSPFHCWSVPCLLVQQYSLWRDSRPFCLSFLFPFHCWLIVLTVPSPVSLLVIVAQTLRPGPLPVINVDIPDFRDVRTVSNINIPGM